MTQRKIDTSGQAPVEVPAITATPRLDWVKIDQLMVDETYQHPLAASNWLIIRRIAEAFDWAKFTPVMVAAIPGGGFYALIDGQHRAHAAALVGLDHIPAMIVDVAPHAQAAAFTAINTQRTAVSAWHIFRAALASREPWAISADRAVRDAGCRLMTSYYSAANKKPAMIFAVTLVRAHVQAGRAALVTRVLTAIKASERGDQVLMYQTRILKPLLAVLMAEPKMPPALLARFISETNLILARHTVGDLRARKEYTRLSDYALAVLAFRALLHKFMRSAVGAA